MNPSDQLDGLRDKILGQSYCFPTVILPKDEALALLDELAALRGENAVLKRVRETYAAVLADKGAEVERLTKERDEAEVERIEWVRRGECAEELCDALRAENEKLRTERDQARALLKEAEDGLIHAKQEFLCEDSCRCKTNQAFQKIRAASKAVDIDSKRACEGWQLSKEAVDTLKDGPEPHRVDHEIDEA
jgi:hypothetical protein